MLAYFAAFALLCCLFVAAMLVRPRRVYEFPYFMAVAFCAFLLPQAYALYSNEWGGMFLKTTLLMCSLCLICCWIGYRPRAHPHFIEILNVRVSPFRFFQGGVVFVAIGSFFTYRSAVVLGELKATGESGLTTGIA